MDTSDKYLVITKYLSDVSIGSIFFIQLNTYPMYPSDHFFFIQLNTYSMYPSDPFFFIQLNTYPMYPSDPFFFYTTKYLSDVSIGSIVKSSE